jgi:hypothetical protein
MHTVSRTGLPKDWVYSPSIDLELKQYTLLGYLQQVKARFAERKIFPYLEDVQDHVAALLQLQRSKELLAKQLGGNLLGFDPKSGAPIHERPQEEDALKVIDEVIAFAVPGLVQMRKQGSSLVQEFSQHIHFEAVGLQPIHVAEGWLLLQHQREARVYRYAVPYVLEPTEHLSHRSIHTRYVTTYTTGLGCTFEVIKADLIERHPSMPNPATFAFETDLDLPFIETFVPLAKRMVQAHLGLAVH